jgi:hypothetical protein
MKLMVAADLFSETLKFRAIEALANTPGGLIS